VVCKTRQSFRTTANEIVLTNTLNLLEKEKNGEIKEIRTEAAQILSKISKEKYGLDISEESILNNDIFYPIFVDKFGMRTTENPWPGEAVKLSNSIQAVGELNPVSIDIQMNKFSKQMKFELDSVSFLYQSSLRLETPELSSLSNRLKSLPQEYGFPDEYALTNYGYSGKQSLSDFAELSSTYRELPISVRTERANSDNPYVKDAYRKLTQLAFDSGKMPVEEYKQIMGNNFCAQNNCCDQKCVVYKLTCTGSCVQ